MNDLEQKLRSETLKFTIIEDGVKVERSVRNHKDSYIVYFDQIHKREYITIKAANALTYLFLFSGLINVILINILLIESKIFPEEYGGYLLLSLLGFFTIIIAIFREHFIRVNIKSLEADRPLEFFYTEKHKQETDEFIDKIKANQRQYFRKKYFRIDPVIPLHMQTDRYLWLYERQFINEGEYRVITEEIENRKVLGID